NRNPKKPTQEERNILAAVKNADHHHSFSDYGRNFRLQTGQRDSILKGLVAADPFWPRMENLFEQMGVPRELTRLSLVESSFNLGATSKVGASGVWQFMPATAKEFMKLNYDAGYDERLSPLKSTVAAAKLLLRNQS